MTRGFGNSRSARFTMFMLAALTLVMSATQASAQAVEGADMKPEETEGPGKHSINVSPLGILFGAYNVNYEYLHNGTHGFLGELGYAHFDDGDTWGNSFAGSGGYRWHWRGKQSSGFLGANVGYQRGWGVGSLDGDPVDLDVQRVIVVGNVGRRWAWDFGLNITLRVGAGYGTWHVTTDSHDPEAQQAVADLKKELAYLPVALDGELSLGWVF